MARVAKSLETLRKQLNELFPDRDKKSDGGLGDPAHARRKSDHNPNSVGVVTARDFTYDTNTLDGEGIDCKKFAEVLFKHKDPRIKYLIFNRKITKPGLTGWKPYSGANPHDKHLHISVSSDAKLYDDPRMWNLEGLISAATSLKTKDDQTNTSLPPINIPDEPETAQTQPDTTKVSVTDGNVKVETSSTETVQEKVAVVGREKQSFFGNIWKKITGWFGGTVGADVLTEKAAQANALGLSGETWNRIFYIAVIAGLIYLAKEFYGHWQWKREQDGLTKLLVESNSTPENKVVVANPAEVEQFRAAGYKIVYRGEKI